MPRTTREKAKRKMDSIINHLNKVDENLRYLFTIYDKSHPDLSDGFIIAGQLNEKMLEHINSVNEAF